MSAPTRCACSILSTAVPVSLNSPVTATLPAGFATAAYSFSAAAGTQLLFSAVQIGADGGQVAVRLIDSAGRQVWGPENFTSHTDLPILSTGGTYTLLVEGQPGLRTGPVPFTFALDTRRRPARLSLSVGAANPSPGPMWGGAPGGTGLTLTGADEVDVPNSAVTTQTGSFTLEVDRAHRPLGQHLDAARRRNRSGRLQPAIRPVCPQRRRDRRGPPGSGRLPILRHQWRPDRDRHVLHHRRRRSTV